MKKIHILSTDHESRTVLCQCDYCDERFNVPFCNLSPRAIRTSEFHQCKPLIKLPLVDNCFNQLGVE